MYKIMNKEKKKRKIIFLTTLFVLISTSFLPVLQGETNHIFVDMNELSNELDLYCYPRNIYNYNTHFSPVQYNNFHYFKKCNNDIPEGASNDVSMIFEDIFPHYGSMDYSPWPMFSHDIRHTGRSPYNVSGNYPTIEWNFSVYGGFSSSPVIDNDGTIYFGGMFDDCLYALNPDGSLKWCGGPTADTVRSSPAIAEDGTIYVGDCGGFLYAFYPNGTLKWECTLGEIYDWIFSPTIGEDGTIYVGSTDYNVYAVNPDGTIKWNYQTEYKVYSSAAIDKNGIIYIGSHDGYVYALYPDGTLKWRFKTDGVVKCPPAIGDDGTIYAGTWGDTLYALHPNGTVLWTFDAGDAIETSPAIALDGTIYIGSYNGLLFSISPKGIENWRFRAGSGIDGWVLSSPALDASGNIYFGCLNGICYALNPDGSLRWKYNIDGDLEMSPAIGKDNTVYFGSTFNAPARGEFVAIKVIENNPPNEPPDSPLITGETSGNTGESYTYEIQGTDPDNDMISYFVDWGDDSDSGWQGPYSSGTSIELSHSWSEKDSYIIKAKVKDEHGLESDWSTLSVTMPKTRPQVFFFHLWEQLIQHLPNISLLFNE